MKLERMFEIVYILLERKKVTADELAQHFEVSKRTILRDIEALSVAGIPVYTEKGRRGGISLMANFVLDKTLISNDEQNQILFALQSLAATHHLDSQSILAKMQGIFGNVDTSWIEVDFARWGNEKTDNQKFELLKNAVTRECALSFTYANSYGDIQPKTVCPLKLIFKSKAWYLQAYCLASKDYRLYKINRITELELLDQRFTRQDFTIPEIENNDSAQSNILELKLLFSKEIAFRAYDEFASENIQENPDGSLLVTTQLPHDYWIYSYLLSLGADVKVIAPQQVRENLLEQIDAIKKLYLDL